MFLECEPDMTVVGYTCNEREALEFFRQHQPDIALMDLQMEGADAIAAICAKFKYARIIVLITFDGNFPY